MASQTLLPNGQVTVIADSREQQSDVIRNLRQFDLQVQQQVLQVGDYLCSDRVGIERKRVQDFLASMTDMRLFEQLEKMVATFDRPLLLIEGNADSLFLQDGIHENAIRGALASIAIDYKVPIIWTRNSMETAAQIYWIAHREQRGEKRPMRIRVTKKADDLPAQQEFLLAGLPSVSTTLAKRLLDHFGTPQAVFHATIEQLCEVDKIGKKKATKIRELLEKNYA
ncbi:MAG: hypothetical protein KKA90_04310 [Nanoarchaeota archaeon]|nr:hypothetical protein [Nanoarchaeota archaeon]